MRGDFERLSKLAKRRGGGAVIAEAVEANRASFEAPSGRLRTRVVDGGKGRIRDLAVLPLRFRWLRLRASRPARRPRSPADADASSPPCR